MTYQEIFDRLWCDYSHDIKAAHEIHQLFTSAGEDVTNDHIALRTFDDPRVDLDVLAQPFIANGYQEMGQYEFKVKKLHAKHYEHKDNPDAPKVFISHLLLSEFSEWAQDFVTRLIDQIPQDILQNSEKLLFAKTPWLPIQYEHYQKLLTESQYAAWLYAYGYRANHFTINVNHLKKYNSIQKVNDFITSHGFELNVAGGAIKGTPAELLEQSSIRAGSQPVEFTEGVFDIPSCYYEFAKRYLDQQGHVYQGFIAASADKIFESTDTQ